MSEKEVLNVDEAAELLRLSKSATYNAVKDGTIPSTRIGRRILITRATIKRLLNSGEAVR